MRTRSLCALAIATLAAGAAPDAGHAAVQVGSSAWSWGNPLPQGNTLLTADFAGGTGYAAGDFGTLLRTDDGGRTWSGLRVGTFETLGVVQALSPATVIAGGGCVARRSDDGGATFRRIAFTNVETACREQLVDLSFVDADTGWIVETDGTVVQTRDGGKAFIQRTAVPGTRAAGGQAMPTSLTAASPTTAFAAASDGKLYLTTDAGVAWKLVADTGDRPLRDIELVGDEHGFAVGARGLLLRTGDGGATWTVRDLQVDGRDLDEIDCADAALCVITTTRGDQLVRTTDGGETSSLVAAATDAIHAAAFASPTVVAAAGAGGATVVSEDAGANFGAIGSRLAGTYAGIRAGGQRGTAYAPGRDGALAITTDAGATWTRGNVATSEDVADVSFPTAALGYALDSAGGVFRTDTAGQTWSALDAGTSVPPAALVAPAADTVLTIGPRGMRRSTDGGGSFADVRGVATLPLAGVDRAGRALVAYGLHAIRRSTDAGATWSVIRRPGRRGRFAGFEVQQADFVDARRGFVLDVHGAVWATRDAGRTYRRLHGVGTGAIEGMAFASATSGYLVVRRFGDAQQDAGFLLHTTDGGATWRPQFVVRTPIGARGIATSDVADYLLGGASDLLSTTTGGDAGAASALRIRTARTRLRRAARIRVTGRLTPASGFERVTVSHRSGGTWRHQTVKAASNGSFSSSFRLAKGVNRFVAQWSGDFKSRGAGSRVLTVTVKR